MLKAIVQLESKDRRLNDVEQGGQRTSLPESPRGVKKGSQSPVNQGGDPRSRNIGSNLADQLGVKSQFEHHSKEKIQLNFIKGVSKVEFNSHTCLAVILA